MIHTQLVPLQLLKIQLHYSKEKLINLLQTSNPYAIGKLYGVSDNAVRKWMETNGIPRTKKAWKEYVMNYNNSNNQKRMEM